MANPATLYRFKIQVSNIDRGHYEDLDLRAAMHPSESEPYLLTRVLAYALQFESGLEFSAGLCTSDEPALGLQGEHGRHLRWIEIGNPSPRKLHKASKACEDVWVYTYKDPDLLVREASSERIHRSESIRIIALDPAFLKSLSGALLRQNDWTLVQNDGELVVTAGQEAFMTSLKEYRLE